MPEPDSGYLSIGEVLGLLLEEFPDVTISKIRFLESQGLISPERTPSGYRKFYDEDVELLRVILNEQKQNYLPLRVIKDRLETGEIVDPTGEHTRNGHRPRERTGDTGEHGRPPVFDQAAHGDADDSGDWSRDLTPAEVPQRSVAGHPAASRNPPQAHLLPGVVLDRAELCAMVGMHDDELAQLESFGVVSATPSSRGTLYDDDAVAIARPAVQFLRAGVDARHLRLFRTAAEREASLYEQLITPRYRHRDPEARSQALASLRQLDQLGAALRAALVRQNLRHHFES
jgi:DNA-binding transcriptional MerR regulator